MIPDRTFLSDAEIRIFFKELMILGNMFSWEHETFVQTPIPYKPNTIQLDIQFHNLLIELTGIQTYIRQYKKVSSRVN